MNVRSRWHAWLHWQRWGGVTAVWLPWFLTDWRVLWEHSSEGCRVFRTKIQFDLCIRLAGLYRLNSGSQRKSDHLDLRFELLSFPLNQARTPLFKFTAFTCVSKYQFQLYCVFWKFQFLRISAVVIIIIMLDGWLQILAWRTTDRFTCIASYYYWQIPTVLDLSCVVCKNCQK